MTFELALIVYPFSVPQYAAFCVQGIAVYLVKLLDRIAIELLIRATAFPKKLSIYQKEQDSAC